MEADKLLPSVATSTISDGNTTTMDDRSASAGLISEMSSGGPSPKAFDGEIDWQAVI